MYFRVGPFNRLCIISLALHSQSLTDTSAIREKLSSKYFQGAWPLRTDWWSKIRTLSGNEYRNMGQYSRDWDHAQSGQALDGSGT